MKRRKMGGNVPPQVRVDKTKAALCDGRRRNPPLDMQTILADIIESVSWVTEDFLWDHEWITETKVTMKKTSYWRLFTTTSECRALSDPTNINRKFVNNGTRVAKFRDTVSSAIELTCNIAFDGAHTPRECFLWAVTFLLCYAPDKDWKLEEEMQG